MQISRRFQVALKSSPVRMYRLAQEVGLHPSTLSKLLNGITPAKADDPRIVRLGSLVGLTPEELFAEELPGGSPAAHPTPIEGHDV